MQQGDKTTETGSSSEPATGDGSAVVRGIVVGPGEGGDVLEPSAPASATETQKYRWTHCPSGAFVRPRRRHACLRHRGSSRRKRHFRATFLTTQRGGSVLATTTSATARTATVTASRAHHHRQSARVLTTTASATARTATIPVTSTAIAASAATFIGGETRVNRQLAAGILVASPEGSEQVSPRTQ